mmetsp:Transcript_421/g.733  ORF Transcript_421/g.733 Transcript_421/m.733 type:complete len:708 (+) Transcript_421:38-2161(+)
MHDSIPGITNEVGDGIGSNDNAVEYSVDSLVHAVQWGDLSFVEKAIDSFGMSPDTTDADGCSLLHWAAINNRIEIVRYLFGKKANVSVIGGKNQETALQWALRCKNCATLVHLFLAEGIDIHHKSSYGCDALFVAVQCGQLKATFMLLHAGANPDTLDANGDTPLYWLLRKPTSRESVDLQRLLLKFHASTTHQSHNDGSNALHILCLSKDKDIEVYCAELVYFAAVAKGDYEEQRLNNSVNKLNVTPYDAAVRGKNGPMVRFFFDIFLYRNFPYWLPIATTAACSGCALCLCLHYLGWLLGIACFVPLHFLGEALQQNSIHTGLSRVPCGQAWSVIVSAMACYFLTMSHDFSFACNAIGVVVSASIIYTFLRATTTVPLHLRGADSPSGRDLLVEKILQAEEQQLLIARQQEQGSPQEDEEGDFKLCTTCLVDKSMASMHCSKCNRCIVSLDHHCPFICNCVGRGNRRMFVMFLLSASVGCLMFAALAWWTMFHTMPDCSPLGTKAAGRHMTGWNAVLQVQLCVAMHHPGYFILVYLTFGVGIWIACLFLGQLGLIGAETTTFEMMKFRNEGINLMSVRGARNLLMFFSSGTYSICTTSTSTANSSSSSSTANGSSTGSIRRPRGGGRGIMQHTSSSSNNNNNNNNKNDSSGMTHSGHSADACCDHNHSHHHSHHHGSGQDKKHDGEFTAVASAEKTNAGTGQYLV